MTPRRTKLEAWCREVLGWGAVLVCLRQVYRTFADGRADISLLYSSDSLYIPDLAADLVHGGRVSAWYVPHATFVFPDLVAWVVLRPLLPSVQATMVAFGVLAVLSAVWVTRWLLVRHFGLARAAGWATVAWCVVLTEVAAGGLQEALDALKPAHHFETAVWVAATFGLAASALKQATRLRVLGLGALCVVGGLSDRFFSVGAALPLAVALAVAALLAPAKRRARLRLSAAVAVLGAVGYRLGGALTRDMADGELVKVYPTLALGELWRLRRMVFTPERSASYWLMWVALACVAIAAVSAVGRLRRETADHGRAFIDLLIFFSIGATEAALIVTANLGNDLFNRYQLVPFFLLVVSLVRAGGLAAERLGVWGPRLATLAAVTLAVVAQIQLPPLAAKLSVLDYQPPLARCLAGLAARHHFRRGLAEFPKARLLTLLSDGALEVEQLGPTGLPILWLNSVDTYAATRGPIGFVVLNGLQAEELQKRYGHPDLEERCGEDVVWVYAPERRQPLAAAVDALAAALPR